MAARPRRSLGMIVKNEEANLRECLQPVRDLFDELIIVDTGSTDGTMSLARELGATVYEVPWTDDFAAARNAVLDRATGDWTMWLDGDDRLAAEDVQKLATLLNELRDEPHAYVLRCACMPTDASTPVQVLHQVRLFPRRAGVRWERRVHEQVLPSLQKTGCMAVRRDITIRHLGYGDPAADQRKAQRNLRLLRLEYATDPTDPVTLFYLGQTHLRLGQLNVGLNYLQSSRKSAPENADWVRSLYALLRDTLQAAGRPQDALAIGAEALERFPGDPVIATAHAILLVQLGQAAAAEQLLHQLLAHPSAALLANGSERTLDLREARHALGALYQQLARHAEADAIFLDLLAEHPTYLLPRVSLGYSYLLQQRLTDAESVAQQLDDNGADPAYGLVMRAEVLASRGEYSAASELVDRAIARAPKFPWARMVRANVLLRAGTDRNACLTALRDVQRLSPECVQTAQLIADLERAGQPQQITHTPHTVTITSGV